jgi:hypothetical protein
MGFSKSKDPMVITEGTSSSCSSEFRSCRLTEYILQPYRKRFVLLIYYSLYFYILVTYSTDGNHPITWTDVEEMVLSGTLPSQVYQMLGHDFYFSFEQRILLAHYYFMMVTYKIENDKIYRSGKINGASIPK